MNNFIESKNNLKKRVILIDFLFVGISFYIAYYYRTGSLALTTTYQKLLLSYYSFWLLINYIEKKYIKLKDVGFIEIFALTGKTTFYLLFFISFMTVLMHLPGFSRKQVLGSCGILFLLESLLFIAFHFIIRDKNESTSKEKNIVKITGISYYRFFLDALLLILSFFIINYIRRSAFVFSDDYLLIAYLITGLWFITSFFTRKFYKNGNGKNIWYMLSPFIKTLILVTFGLTVAVFLLSFFYLSRLELFGTLLILGILELTTFSALFVLKKYGANNQDIESVDEIQKISNQKNLQITHNQKKDNPVGEILKDEFLAEQPEIYYFIQSFIDLCTIDEDSLTVLDTRTSYNIQHMKPGSVSLFINLHQLNDFRWLNRYLIILHNKISDGGYIVGNLETIEQHKKQFFQKMPNYLAQILYIPNFIFRRALPKLPVLKQLYFMLTDGKNRALSKAEAFGRLHFCGFSIVAEQEIDNRLYFIARKVKTTSLDQNPSYSPVIKLPRIGLNGEVIQIYKFRTMYPYSEYLQEYVYQRNQLDEKGKMKNDFRMTGWGRIFRKLWIDELPQIINWLKGDVSLVGVRALSQQFFDLYPRDLQLFRIQFKPGLVPPYYADMPKSFAEILESERKYLQRKKDKPFTTDIIYFYKAFYNIIFRHARSG